MWSRTNVELKAVISFNILFNSLYIKSEVFVEVISRLSAYAYLETKVILNSIAWMEGFKIQPINSPKPWHGCLHH